MSWLRLDDGLRQHPKLLKVPRADRWTWLELLLYCAQYGTDGRLSTGIREAVPYATPKLLATLVEVGLLDEDEDGWIVHDWAVYNPRDPTAASRSQRYRSRNANRDADRNGDRDEGRDDQRDADRDENVTVTAPRARASAPVPVPSPTSLSPKGSFPSSPSRRRAGGYGSNAEALPAPPRRTVEEQFLDFLDSPGASLDTLDAYAAEEELGRRERMGKGKRVPEPRRSELLAIAAARHEQACAPKPFVGEEPT